MGDPGERRIITPLSSSFMLISIIGFLISVFYVPALDWGTLTKYVDTGEAVEPVQISYSKAYGISFAIVFAAMFLASLISMTYSPFSEHLQIDEKRRIKV